VSLIEVEEYAMQGFMIAAVIIMIVLGLLVVIQMIAITALLLMMKTLAQEIREQVEPVAAQVRMLMQTVNELAKTLQGKTEHIAETTAGTTDVVADRVKKTTLLLQRLLVSPLISGAATTEGIVRGVKAWRQERHRRHAPPTTAGESATPPNE
jgi:hypothetical protein